MESRVLSETIMKRVFLILALLSLGASAAHASDDPCFEKAQTQSQLTACSADALKREDAALNQSYKKMQERLKADAATLRLLVDSQRKWIAFRDAECTFTTVRTAGGSVQPMNTNSCLAQLTRNRTIELQNHLACGKGADEQTALECALPR